MKAPMLDRFQIMKRGEKISLDTFPGANSYSVSRDNNER